MHVAQFILGKPFVDLGSSAEIEKSERKEEKKENRALITEKYPHNWEKVRKTAGGSFFGIKTRLFRNISTGRIHEHFRGGCKLPAR